MIELPTVGNIVVMQPQERAFFQAASVIGNKVVIGIIGCEDGKRLETLIDFQ